MSSSPRYETDGDDAHSAHSQLAIRTVRRASVPGDKIAADGEAPSIV